MALRLPEVYKCCFCFSLRVGTLILGYLGIISVLVNITSNVFLLVLVARSPSGPGPERPGVPHLDQTTEKQVYVTLGLQLLVLTANLVINVFLVVGTHKRIPRYLLAYLYVGGVNLCLNLLLIIVTAIFSGFFVTMGQLLLCALQFYFLLVVRSTMTEMLEEQKPPPTYELQYQAVPAAEARATVQHNSS